MIAFFRLIVPVICFITTIVGFINLKKLKSNFWFSLFPYYLFIIASLDFFGYFITKQHSNTVYFTYLVFPIQGLFHILLYYSNSKIKSHKYFIKLILLALLISYFWFWFFLSSDIQLLTVIYNNNVLIALFIVILLYFFELFNSENIFHFQEDLRFWISIGLIIFYLFGFPYSTFRSLVFSGNYNIGMPMFYVHNSLSCLMYILFAIGIIKSKISENVI